MSIYEHLSEFLGGALDAFFRHLQESFDTNPNKQNTLPIGPEDIIDFAFSWTNSSEGFAYWDNMDDGWRDFVYNTEDLIEEMICYKDLINKYKASRSKQVGSIF